MVASAVVDELDEFTDERELSVVLFHKSAGGAVDRSRYLRLLCDRDSRDMMVLRANLGSPWRMMQVVTTRFDASPAQWVPMVFVDGEVVSHTAFDRILAAALTSDHLIAKVDVGEPVSFDLRSARPDFARLQGTMRLVATERCGEMRCGWLVPLTLAPTDEDIASTSSGARGHDR